MRIRATLAAATVSGALALAAFAVPAAQATDGTGLAQAHNLAQQASGHQSGMQARSLTAADSGDPYVLNATFSNIKVNSSKSAIVVGTTNAVHVSYSFTFTHASDADPTADDFVSGIDIYRNTDDGNFLFGDAPATCTAASSTVANCKGSIDIHPQEELTNADAGAHWTGEAFATAYNGQDPSDPNIDWSKVGTAYQDAVSSNALQRYSKLTVNASPEPVKKGGTLTITGALTRANWDTHKYAGYTVQPVKLQFRKTSSSSYPTTYLKTVTSSSTGSLKTTYTATYSGYWRYNFLGTSTTPAVKATGDYVAVQ
ncbi:hypothetical protein ACFCW6_27945 [Streptomyces sp. NPDC056333]|uniref:hypothetical protein n=1 Tax=Streptomyces sp. NPDC056333 TaxID=3345786 RepID=UPI0035DC6B03